MRLRARLAATAVLAASVAAPDLGHAQEFFYTYSTTGCFFVGSSCAATSVFGGLVSFSGQAATSGSTEFGVPVNLALGAFNVSGTGSTTMIIEPTAFNLFLAFSQPSGATPGAYGATVSGVLQRSASGLRVTFENPTTRAFSSADGTTFDVTIQQGYVEKGVVKEGILLPVGTSTLQGTLDNIVTPEPATLTLLATGLVGLYAALRRRRTLLVSV